MTERGERERERERERKRERERERERDRGNILKVTVSCFRQVCVQYFLLDLREP